MKDKELREEFEPIVEITKRIAQIAGILNGSAVHDTGQTVVAQQKLGEILGFLDQALKAKEEEVVGRVEKLIDSVASHFNATRIRQDNGESIWAFSDRSSELRERENYQVSLVLMAFDEGLSSPKEMKTPTLSKIAKEFRKKFCYECPYGFIRIGDQVAKPFEQFYQDKILEMLEYLEMEKIAIPSQLENKEWGKGYNKSVSEVNEKIKKIKEDK